MNPAAAAPRLAADHFDGSSGRAHPVQAWLHAGRLHWAGPEQPARDVPVRSAVWPERQRHGQRQVQLPDGGLLVFADAAAFDAWAAAGGVRAGGVVRWQQSWRLTLLAFALFVASLGVLWRWGIPAAARIAVAAMPAAVQVRIGERTLEYADRSWLKPSQLSSDEQAQVTQRFAEAVSAAQARSGPQPAYRIVFRDGGKMEPNAFALPDGTLVVTDALVTLLRDEPQAVVGVLAHELGHVRHQHGLRQAAQAGAVGVVAGLVVGDFSYLLATAPALLVQMDYSREFERQADAHARDLIRAARIDPRVMLVFFDRVEQQARKDAGQQLPSVFSTHPANRERIEFFSER